MHPNGALGQTRPTRFGVQSTSVGLEMNRLTSLLVLAWLTITAGAQTVTQESFTNLNLTIPDNDPPAWRTCARFAAARRAASSST